MIVFDTNVVSELFKPEPNTNVIAWAVSAQQVALTTITVAELMFGVERLPPGKRRSRLARELTSLFAAHRDTGAILPFDEAAAAEFALAKRAREARGLHGHHADMQIAAICRVHRAQLATRNTNDFSETEVSLINPFQPADV